MTAIRSEIIKALEIINDNVTSLAKNEERKVGMETEKGKDGTRQHIEKKHNKV